MTAILFCPLLLPSHTYTSIVYIKVKIPYWVKLTSYPHPFSNSKAEALTSLSGSRLSSDISSMVIGAYCRSEAEGASSLMGFLATYYTRMFPTKEAVVWSWAVTKARLKESWDNWWWGEYLGALMSPISESLTMKRTQLFVEFCFNWERQTYFVLRRITGVLSLHYTF